MNATSEFLAVQYGQTEGFAWLGIKSATGTFTETTFSWPAQKDQMVREIQMANAEGCEVWFTAHLSQSDKKKSEGGLGRAKGQSVERHRIHADIDRALTSEDRQKIAELGAWTVFSGSEGHAHVYVELDRNVSLEEYEQLNRALVKHLAADKGKFSDNDLLRIPGTDNHKPQGGPVKLGLPYKKATVWSPELLASKLPVAELVQKAAAVTSGAINLEAIDIIPPRVQDSIDMQTGDRSKDTFALVCACAKSGLTLEQTAGVVLSQPNLKKRYDEKGLKFQTEELHRIWGTAYEKASNVVSYAADEDDWAAIMGPDWKPSTPTDINPNQLSDVKSPAASRFKFIKASETAPMRLQEWLAEGRIPQSATTILVGDEGIGKSLLWVHLAAIITNGWAAPHLGMKAGPKRYVVLVSNEEDLTTQTKQRLTVAGVDLDYVIIVTEDETGIHSPTFPDPATWQMMRDSMAGYDVALVVVDTWVSSLKVTDIKDAVKARAALQPWTEFAQEFKTSVLLVTHTNRINSKNARDIMGATSELRKAARCVLLAQLDDQKRLTVGVDKSNVSAITEAAMFEQELVNLTFEGGKVASWPKLKYVGDSDKTAAEILEQRVDSQDDKSEVKITAKEWVEEILRNNGGSMLSNDLTQMGKAAGYTEDQIQYAKRKLGVKPQRQQLPNGKFGVLSVL